MAPAPVRAALLALALVAPLALAGCLELSAARVPDRLLEGRGGNGWAKNLTASQDEPTSASGGTVKTQTLAYEDRQSEAGYPGTLTVTTVRTLLRPSEESVRDQVESQIAKQVRAKGVKLQGAAVEGTRTLASGAESYWFVHNGSVETQGTFSRNAQVKIFGEVFQCSDEKTVVAVVGLAQTTDVRSIGGVALPSEPDTTTWREIVADPRGSIEGLRGSAGLAHNVAC